MARKDASPLLVAALLSAVLSLGVFLVAGGLGGRPSGGAGSSPRTPVSAAALGPAPLAFERAGGGAYRTRGRGYQLLVDGSGSRLVVDGSAAVALRTRLIGARPGTADAGHRLPLVVNRYSGPRSSWRTGIPTYGRVTYRSVYPGIDLRYHGGGGMLEYDFVVSPGASANRIGLDLAGARSVRISRDGDLLVAIHGGTVRQHRPLTYQQAGGRRVRVASRFVVRGGRVRFALGRYDHSRPLVIDPSLAFGDYIGGTGSDQGGRMAIDSAGNMFLAATSSSTAIPAVGTTNTAKKSGNDAFVMKIAPDGTRLWITYLGGSLSDAANDIGLDSSGRPVVVGQTASTDFPTQGASVLQPASAGGARDAFVSALAANGSLRWSTYLGTTAADTSGQVAVTPSGNAYVALNIETLDGQGNPIPPMRGYAYVFDSSGAAVNSYVHGDGTHDDTVDGVAPLPGCDATNCQAYVTGHFLIADPNNAGQNIRAGYIERWNFASTTSVWVTPFTTPTDLDHNGQLEYPGGEWPAAVTTDPAGNAIVGGTTTVNSHTWAFLVRFGKDTDNQGVIIDTPYMQFSNPPLNGDSFGSDVASDAEGNIYFAGTSLATNGSGQDAVQPKSGGAYDGAVVKYFPDGPPARPIQGDPTAAHPNARIVWSTALGGVDNDLAFGIVTDGSGGTYVSGQAGSTFIPSPATHNLAATPDAFIVKIQTNSATVTAGPDGLTRTRDATFKYSSSETGGTYQCRLITPTATPGFSDCDGTSAFTGLTDGSYAFEIKAWDSGGTTSGQVTSRAFKVDTSPVATFSIAPNPALAGRAVTFDASASVPSITKYEWDLDGNGTFEKDNGSNPVVTQTYPVAGTFNVGLRVTDGEGKTSTTSAALLVNNAGGGSGQFGVTIDNGAQFTNRPDVTVTSTFPSFTTALLFSNDGGFGKAQTLPAQKETKWKLDSSGPERLPKTLYVRFLTGSIAGETHQDDIILDETPPKVDQAQVAPAPAAAASAARLRAFKVKVKAHDTNSGVSKLQVTANKRKPGKALKYKTKLVVRSARRPKWVRARDRAGNWSKWKKAR